MNYPLAIDLFCGLSGWGEGLLCEGFRVIGFDIENMFSALNHPMPKGDFSLVLQDVRTLHGKQFKNVSLIVASPPCQEYSYMAMPWSKAKRLQREYETGARECAKLTELFDACFRIQREACEAAGHHIPLVVENVRGAQKWVGRSRWNYGSFHLWGDVPALMPMTRRCAMKHGIITHRSNDATNFHGVKAPGMNWSDRTKHGQDFTRVAGRKNSGGSWFNIAHNTTSGCGQNPDGRKQHKSGRAWFADPDSISGSTSSKSPARKFASAMIAKIPLPLARHIARYWHPRAGGGMIISRRRPA